MCEPSHNVRPHHDSFEVLVLGPSVRQALYPVSQAQGELHSVTGHPSPESVGEACEMRLPNSGELYERKAGGAMRDWRKCGWL